MGRRATAFTFSAARSQDGVVYFRILNVALVALALIAIAINAYGLVDLALNFSSYRFGTEVGSARYRSANVYVAISLLELALATVVLAVGKTRPPKPKWMLVRVAVLIGIVCIELS